MASIRWINPVGGSWSDAANWDLGRRPAAGDDVEIQVPGPDVTITHAAGTDAIQSLTATERVVLSGGSLTVTGPLSSTVPFVLSGGTLSGANVASGTTIAVSPNGTLQGLTLAGELDLASVNANVSIRGSFTLQGGSIHLGDDGHTVGVLRFLDSTPRLLGGTGTIWLGSSFHNSIQPPTPGLTIGPGVFIRGRSGTIGTHSAPLEIQGRIEAEVVGGDITIVGTTPTIAPTAVLRGAPGTTLTLMGSGTAGHTGPSWTNYGHIEAERATLYLGRENSWGDIEEWTNAGQIHTVDTKVYIGGTVRTGNLGDLTTAGGSVHIVGVIENADATLAVGGAAVPWSLEGGTVRGGRITTPESGRLLGSSTPGSTLVGVTLAGLLDLSQGYAQIKEGLTLDGGEVRLGAEQTVGYLTFVGSQTLGGTGRVLLGSSFYNALKGVTRNMTLTIGPGVTIRGQAGLITGAEASGGEFNLHVLNQGRLQADAGGQGDGIALSALEWVNRGLVCATAGGELAFRPTVEFDGSGALALAPSATLRVEGALLGDTRNVDQFEPLGTVRWTGHGTPTSPQVLEVMGRDLGPVNAGFTRNFAYGAMTLAAATHLQLRDVADNADGPGPEAVYVGSLSVPAGATLDLNGLHLYARQTQVQGTVLGGTVSELPDGGAIQKGVPAAGTIATVGQVDEWELFARAGQSLTIQVNPGGSGLPAPLPPLLQWVEVQVLDAAGTVLATGRNGAAGALLTVWDVAIPADGVIRVRVLAHRDHATSTGHYVMTVWESASDVAPLTLSTAMLGRLETPYSRDQWVFTAQAGQQVQFLLVNSTSQGLRFELTGPGGYVGFTNLAADSSPLTLPSTGTYTLTTYWGPGTYSTAAYQFRMDALREEQLQLGTPFDGEFAGPRQTFRFRVDVPVTAPLHVVLTDSASDNHVEVYARRGSPPTRAAYDHRAATMTPTTEELLVPMTVPGTWYLLVYDDHVPSPGAFRLLVSAEPVVVTAVTPDHHANSVDAVLTIGGAGFDATTAVELVSGTGTVYPASAVQGDRSTQLTATFRAGTVPPGTYAVRARRLDGATSELPGAFTFVAGATSDLRTQLILPSGVGPRAQATIFAECTNAGTVAMAAPLLVVRATDRALLTLDASARARGSWTSAVPEGFTDVVQFLGSGIVPGLLQPGEVVRVPVYYVGLTPPWDFTDDEIEFRLEVLTRDDPEPIDWPALAAATRPASVPPDVWDLVTANLVAQVGTTWGDHVRMLGANANYLGRLGEDVQDAGDLWQFEVAQAIGLRAGASLATAVDADNPAPGLPLTLSRTFGEGILARNQVGPFGRGWVLGGHWQRRLTVGPDGAVTLTDPAGGTRRFEPDSRNSGYFAEAGVTSRLIKLGASTYALEDVDGTTTRFRDDGRIDWIEDPNGNRITAAHAAGRLTDLTHSSGRSLQLAYNAQGRIDSLTDAFGRVTRYAYDASGEHLTQVTLPCGRSVRYSYSTGGDPKIEHALLAIEERDGTHQFFTYDAAGRLASTARDGLAERLTYAYDTAGTVSVTNGVGATWQSFYDHRVRLAKTVDPRGQIGLRTYDGNDNLVAVTDASGLTTSYDVDAWGNVLRVRDALGNTTQFAYGEPFHRLTSATNANGQTTLYGYDASGNLLSIADPANRVERFRYDAQGNLDATTNRRGQVIDVAYNADGQIQTRLLPDGTTATYVYNARGNLGRVTDATGSTVYEYLDPTHPDHVTRITYPNDQFLEFSYVDGHRTRMVDQDGFAVNYQYDAVGRLDSLRDGAGQSLVRYQYDAAGRLAREDQGNGTWTTCSYDLGGQILEVVHHAPDGSVNARFAYTYDRVGRRTSMATLAGTWTYRYDGIGQLTHATFASADPATIPNQSLEYQYDAAGNRVRTLLNGVTTDYAVNALGQYTTVGSSVLTYDADGNLIRRSNGPDTETYAYDALNRLIGVTTPAGTWTYGYDAAGNRVSSAFNGQTTRYLVDPYGLGDVVSEQTGPGGPTTHFVHGLGLLGRVGPVDDVSYYDADALGSIVGLSGAAGTYLNRYGYLPFGELMAATEAVPNPFEYVGAYGVMAEPTGLQFMRERYYAPALGAFTSADPVDVAALNSYPYATNNPVSFADPIGLQAEEFCGFDWVPDPVAPGDLQTLSLRRLPCPKEPEEPDPNPLDVVPLVPCRSGLRPCFDPPKPPPRPPRRPPQPPPRPPRPKRPIPKYGSKDPNQKTGPAGFGSQAFIAPGSSFSYRIDFENEARATAPAQRVEVTDQLDPDLDWSTFQLTGFGFGDRHDTIPGGLSSYQGSLPVTLGGQSFQLDVAIDLDRATGLVRAVFQSVDPSTGLPPDALTGFLPPEDGTGRGQGYFTYLVQPRANLPTGTEVRNIALITFDQGETIATNQVDPHDPTRGTDPTKEALNTIDAAPPTSAVAPLPATTATASVLVSWAGQDDPGGSGIAAFSVYVATDGGAFALWLDGTTATSAVFQGEAGHSYGFSSRARDQVGHVEEAPTQPDATTRITPSLVVDAGPDQSIQEGGRLDLTGASFTTTIDPAELSVRIDWGDGQSEPGVLTPRPGGGTIANSHVYSGNGTFAVILALQDQTGRTVQDELTVQVANVAPTVVLPSLAAIRERTRVAARGWFVDAGADRWTAQVDYGDGTGVAPLGLAPDRSFALDHRYDAPGTYTITVAVRDDDQGTGQSTTTVNVLDVPPTVLSLGPIQQGQNVTGVLLRFSEPMTVGRTQLRKNYEIVQAGPDRRFGTRDDQSSSLRSVRYDTSRWTVTVTPSRPVPASMPCRLKVKATDPGTGVTDARGTLLDGDGNGRTGGDYLGVFGPPLVVTRFQATTTPTRITGLVLTFSDLLETRRAQDLRNYTLLSAGPDRLFGTRDDRPLTLGRALYRASNRTVTLTPASSLPRSTAYRLTVSGNAARGGLTALAGYALDGDRNKVPGGDYVGQIKPFRTTRISARAFDALACFDELDRIGLEHVDR